MTNHYLSITLTTFAFALNLGLNATVHATEENLKQLPPAEQVENGAQEEMYDTDTGTWLVDTDGDTFPDLTEERRGTNPLDGKDFPGAELQVPNEEETSMKPANVSGFPTGSCRPGYIQAGPRLCISQKPRDENYYDDAIVDCRKQGGRVATYGDLYYLYIVTTQDATYDPKDKWIGNIVGDDDMLYGNKSITRNNDPDIYNFEGINTNKSKKRMYWCAHDDES
jgi:hypothetical protein